MALLCSVFFIQVGPSFALDYKGEVQLQGRYFPNAATIDAQSYSSSYSTALGSEFYRERHGYYDSSVLTTIFYQAWTEVFQYFIHLVVNIQLGNGVGFLFLEMFSFDITFVEGYPLL